MRNRNFLSEREREIADLSDLFEKARSEGRTPYMDVDDMADLADWYAWEGDYDKAFDVINCGLKLHPDSGVLLVQLTYLYLDSNEDDLAEETFLHVLDSDDVEPDEVKVLEANICMTSGQIDRMEELIKEIDIYDSLHSLVEVAYLYADSGQPRKGLKLLLEQKDEWADDEAYLATLGDCYRLTGMHKEAVEVYNQLLDREPYNPAYWCAIARSYIALGQNDKAIDATDYALTTDEDCIDAYNLRGQAYYNLGNIEEATKSLQTMEDRGLVSPLTVSVFKAVERVDHGFYDEGLRLLEEIFTRVPPDFELLPVAYTTAALCAHRLGDSRKAHRYIQRSLQLTPEDVEVYLAKGRIEMEEGHPEKAMRTWKKGIRFSPTAENWMNVAYLCIENNQKELARQAVVQAVRLDPYNPEAQKFLKGESE